MTYRLLDTQEIKKALSWLTKYWDRPVHPEYFNARTINEAISLLDEFKSDAKIIAGGVDVVGLLKYRMLTPRALVNIKSISSLRKIAEGPAGLELGALTLINDIERSGLIKSKYPILLETAQAIASPHLRNMATVAGNLCQDARCMYYRRAPDTGMTFNCRRKNEHSKCYALDGENQSHGIFGAEKCCAVCPSDMATTLLALDAKVKTVSTSGGRTIPLDRFYTTLGNALENGEIVTGIDIPALKPETRQKYLKFRVRKTIDFALVSATTVVTLEKEVVTDARVVLGGVDYQPYRATKAEEILKGEKLTESVVERAAKAALSGAKPLSKNDYKIPIAETLIKRALLGN